MARRIDKMRMPFEADRDTDRFAKMTPADRLALCLELCTLTDSIVSGRPDAERLRSAAPRSPEAEATWKRLIEARRRDRP